MDRQSSGPLTNIPVAGRDYEGGKNIVGGRMSFYSAEVRVARLSHRRDCDWDPGYEYRFIPRR